MNRIVTSKEILLKAAKKIAYQEGLSQLNIRRISHECGIAVGSVYNYFPSKSDLIFAVIEDFWSNVFHKNICDMPDQISFPAFFAQLYERLYSRLKDFETVFLSQMTTLLSSEEKEKGRNIQEKYWTHMREGLYHALEQDNSISSEVWTPLFTKDSFVKFVFSNMLTMLRSRQEDCTFFQEVLRRQLYR